MNILLLAISIVSNSVWCVHTELPAPVAPKSGDTIIINDGRPMLILDEEHYMAAMDKVSRVSLIMESLMNRDCKTRAGRIRWHGQCTNTVYQADGSRTEYYEDGATFIDNPAPSSRTPKNLPKRAVRKPHDRYSHLPPKLAERKRKEDELKDNPKTVTATFTAGGKLQEVK